MHNKENQLFIARYCGDIHRSSYHLAFCSLALDFSLSVRLCVCLPMVYVRAYDLFYFIFHSCCRFLITFYIFGVRRRCARACYSWNSSYWTVYTSWQCVFKANNVTRLVSYETYMYIHSNNNNEIKTIENKNEQQKQSRFCYAFYSNSACFTFVLLLFSPDRIGSQSSNSQMCIGSLAHTMRRNVVGMFADVGWRMCFEYMHAERVRHSNCQFVWCDII